jgi:hypothetical protein
VPARDSLAICLPQCEGNGRFGGAGLIYWRMWELNVVGSRSSSFPIIAVLIASMCVAGCASTAGNGDPGAIAMPAGQSCQSTRAELNKLDAKGIQGKFEAQQRGQKLAPPAQAEVDRYNLLLNQYLGARCHV